MFWGGNGNGMPVGLEYGGMCVVVMRQVVIFVSVGVLKYC